jgi:hypothetical protein
MVRESPVFGDYTCFCSHLGYNRRSNNTFMECMMLKNNEEYLPMSDISSKIEDSLYILYEKLSVEDFTLFDMVSSDLEKALELIQDSISHIESINKTIKDHDDYY